MTHKISLYHGTSKEKVKSILNNGLIRPPKGRTYQAPIYLSHSVKEAVKFGKDNVLKVTISKRLFNSKCGYQEDNGGYLRSYPVCYVNIPKKSIKLMSEKQVERKLKQEARHSSQA